MSTVGLKEEQRLLALSLIDCNSQSEASCIVSDWLLQVINKHKQTNKQTNNINKEQNFYYHIIVRKLPIL